MQDDTRSDAELAAELAAIDASAHQDSPAALTASLGGRRDLLALVAAHHAAASARRLVVVELLSDAALPRRIAAFDRLLEAERASLAAAREELAALPWPDTVSDFTARCQAKHARRMLRRRIEGQLYRIGSLAAERARLIARRGPAAGRSKKASEKGFLAPWRGFGTLPLPELAKNLKPRCTGSPGHHKPPLAESPFFLPFPPRPSLGEIGADHPSEPICEQQAAARKAGSTGLA